jgi:hypothetical protein
VIGSPTSAAMPISSIEINGNVTLQRPLILQSAANYVAPTSDIMLGGITNGTYPTYTFPITTSTTLATITLVKATYMVYFAFQLDCAPPSTSYITLTGTAVGQNSNYRFGITTIVSGSNYGLSGSFPVSITTAGTIVLTLNFAGSITGLNVKIFQAVRIG